MFWDSSALVPLLIPEPRSPELAALLASEPKMAMWWSTPLECQSAIYRRHREVPLPEPAIDQALDRLRQLVDDADTIDPSGALRNRAARLIATHALRAADALQLAAALAWYDERPRQAGFVCLDRRLRDAAVAEGFQVLPAQV